MGQYPVDGGRSGFVFFLGSGYVDSAPYYFFRYKTPDGGTKLRKLRAESATVYEEKRTDAYITEILDEKRFNWSWLLNPINTSAHISGYAIHVREGSVKKEINLDLKDLR